MKYISIPYEEFDRMKKKTEKPAFTPANQKPGGPGPPSPPPRPEERPLSPKSDPSPPQSQTAAPLPQSVAESDSTRPHLPTAVENGLPPPPVIPESRKRRKIKLVVRGSTNVKGKKSKAQPSPPLLLKKEELKDLKKPR